MKRLVLSLVVFALLISSLMTFGISDNATFVFNNTDNISMDATDTNEIIDIDSDLSNVITKSNERRVVYLGGIPLGIDVKSNGLVITGVQDVITAKGAVSPCKDIDIKNGDLLISIDDNRVFSEQDVIDNVRGKDVVDIVINRNGFEKKYTIHTAKDVLNNSEKLGLWLKDGITGIGTLTYIDGVSRRYGALGHPIEENKSYRSGKIYNANIDGYIKGEKGKAGELDGTILGGKPLGTVDKNNTFGIFGTFVGKLNDYREIEIANRDEIKPGKAQIYTTIDGGTPKFYDIEIIKKAHQSKPQNKGMVIRIIDDELLGKTNGILQGMSGSPIVQNGKLIGAVTHVFINDPTKGYGMYIDFMLDN